MKLRNLLGVGLCALTLAGAAIACGGDDSSSGGGGSKDTCSADQTYAKVGKPFTDKYCISCHSADQDTADLLGDGHQFATLKDIEGHGHEIYEQVESGQMPKGSAGLVKAAEKTAFLEWLECSGLSDAGGDHDHD